MVAWPRRSETTLGWDTGPQGSRVSRRGVCPTASTFPQRVPRYRQKAQARGRQRGGHHGLRGTKTPIRHRTSGSLRCSDALLTPLHGAARRLSFGARRRSARPRGRDPRPSPPSEGPAAQSRPPHAALVMLHRHPGHAPWLASRACAAQVDLPARENRTSAARPRDRPAHQAHGQGQPALGLRQNPGGATQARRSRRGELYQAATTTPRDLSAGSSSEHPRSRATSIPWRSCQRSSGGICSAA
jgi:hypothetical protein